MVKLLFVTILPFILIIFALSFLASSHQLILQPTTKAQNSINKSDRETGSDVLGTKDNREPTGSHVSRTIYLGSWTQGFWEEGKLHPQKLTELETKVSKRFAIAHYYRGWEALATDQFGSELEMINSFGWRPMVSVNPYFFDRCQADGKSLYQTIALGKCDLFLESAANILKHFDKPVFLRFAWEVNIPTIEWSTKHTGDAPNDFISAWRHIHDVFISRRATNILWVFSPNTEYDGSIPYEELYPGDAYVDWLGLDGYNWGTSRPERSWQSFHDVYAISYAHLTRIAPGKPLMLAEVNTTHVGGDKADWYKDMLEVQIPQYFPAISAIVLYNENRMEQEKVNWLIDISATSLESFQKGVNSNIYKSSF